MRPLQPKTPTSSVRNCIDGGDDPGQVPTTAKAWSALSESLDEALSKSIPILFPILFPSLFPSRLGPTAHRAPRPHPPYHWATTSPAGPPSAALTRISASRARARGAHALHGGLQPVLALEGPQGEGRCV